MVARGCPRRFAPLVRHGWTALSGERYFIDRAGRPERAVTRLPPIRADARDVGCQRRVDAWGELAALGPDYDGGHLIGAQLGGWGARANLVPQVASFNRGCWKVLEDWVAACEGQLADGQLKMEVTVVYDDASTLIPSRMLMTLTDVRRGNEITLSFDNARQGGPQGPREKQRGVAWLRGLGCVKENGARSAARNAAQR